MNYFLFIKSFLFFFGVVGVILLVLAYLTNKKNKELITESDNTKVSKEYVNETVKITDINGSVQEVSTGLCISDPDRVLVVDGGKTYHTHISCFKNWTPEMRENFTGWKIISKKEAISKGMKYCKFCEENDDITLDDTENEEL